MCGYFESTIGMNKNVIWKYMHNQEDVDKKNESGFGDCFHTSIETDRFERFTFQVATFGCGK